MSEHIVSPKSYVAVYIALMVLLFATLGAAYIDMGHGSINYAVSLSIAVIKALLIILIFMHVKYSPRLTALFATASFLWLAILITLSLSDYFTRDWLSVFGK